MQHTFDQYHIEYLCEQYERLQVLAENRALVSKDKIETMKRALKSYDKDGNGVLDRQEVLDLLTNHLESRESRISQPRPTLTTSSISSMRITRVRLSLQSSKSSWLRSCTRTSSAPSENILYFRALIFNDMLSVPPFKIQLN